MITSLSLGQKNKLANCFEKQSKVKLKSNYYKALTEKRNKFEGSDLPYDVFMLKLT